MKQSRIFRLFAFALLFSGILFTSKPIYFYVRLYLSEIILMNHWNEIKKGDKIKNNFLNLIPIGRIIIPDVNLDTIVLDGSDERILSYGLGKVQNGSKIHEKRNNIVISGHRDTHFKKLKAINIGDKITLEHLEGESKYAVDDIFLVDPDETNYIEKNKNNTLTLITCFPFDYIGSAPLRMIVVGKIIL